MKLAGVIQDAAAAGLVLSLKPDGGVRVEGPRAALTPERLARLRAHKAALGRFLERARHADPLALALALHVLDAQPEPQREGGGR